MKRNRVFKKNPVFTEKLGFRKEQRLELTVYYREEEQYAAEIRL